MKAVMRKALNSDGWLRLSAHVIFSILDYLERFVIFRRQKQIPSDQVAIYLLSSARILLLKDCCIAICDSIIPLTNLKNFSKVLTRCEGLLRRILSDRLPDNTLLTVLVAERCHCTTRALKW